MDCRDQVPTAVSGHAQTTVSGRRTPDDSTPDQVVLPRQVNDEATRFTNHVVAVPNLREIFLIGFYQLDDNMTQFINSISKEFKVIVRYLQEYTSLGTAGGIFHFRDQIRRGNPEGFFLINSDVCGHFELSSMLQFHRQLTGNMITLMATEATRSQSVNYGCIVEDEHTHEVMHYVEKPETFVSQIINCGVYLCSMDIFAYLADVYRAKHEINLENSGEYSDNDVEVLDPDNDDCIFLEEDVLTRLAGSGRMHVYHTTNWWSQIKTAGSAIYANRKYLEQLRVECPQQLAEASDNGPTIIGDVIVDPTASIDPTAVLGPNVSIGKGVRIGAGVRIKESIVLPDATINDHSLIMHAIVGWNNTIGAWSRECIVVTTTIYSLAFSFRS